MEGTNDVFLEQIVDLKERVPVLRWQVIKLICSGVEKKKFRENVVVSKVMEDTRKSFTPHAEVQLSGENIDEMSCLKYLLQQCQ